MGEWSLEASSPAEARGRHGDALAIAREITSPLEEARALEGIGNCHLREGRVADGDARLRQALAIYLRISSPHAKRIKATLGGHPIP
jgi:hypothetical protein